MPTFTAKQVEYLLKPINVSRVMQANGHSHLPQQDILAHLTRAFGFGGFDFHMISCNLVFEQPTIRNQQEVPGRFDVCYKAFMRLTVRNPDGEVVCEFEDGSTGDASNNTRADAHDLAMKSAISLAKKRCAIALGDMFGLSLYNKGSVQPIVRGTLVLPGAVVETVTSEVDPPQSLGVDEIDRPNHRDDNPEPKERPAESQQQRSEPRADTRPTGARPKNGPVPADQVEAAAKLFRDAVDKATDKGVLGQLWADAQRFPEVEAAQLRKLVESRAKAVGLVAVDKERLDAATRPNVSEDVA